MEIYDINDWMNELSNAIDSFDIDKIERLEHITIGWLQGNNELNAQLKLLESARNIIDEVLYYAEEED